MYKEKDQLILVVERDNHVNQRIFFLVYYYKTFFYHEMVILNINREKNEGMKEKKSEDRKKRKTNKYIFIRYLN